MCTTCSPCGVSVKKADKFPRNFRETTLPAGKRYMVFTNGTAVTLNRNTGSSYPAFKIVERGGGYGGADIVRGEFHGVRLPKDVLIREYKKSKHGAVAIVTYGQIVGFTNPSGKATCSGLSG